MIGARAWVLALGVVSFGLTLGVTPSLGFPEPRSSPAAPEVVPGEVIVRWRPQALGAQRASLRAQTRSALKRQFRNPDLELLDIGDRDPVQAAAELSRDASVAYAEPNYRLYTMAARRFTPARTPNDPLFPGMWGLHNTGQTGGTAGADVRALAAWDVFTGSDEVLVGVIDTGIDYEHPDLADNVWRNPGEIAGNDLDDDGNGYVDDIHGYDTANQDADPLDDHGHGTHVAGTIAARGDNGLGVTGVCWRTKLVAIKFLDRGGSGSTAAAIAAIDYALAVGARLTNNSWGGGGFSQALLEAIREAHSAGQLFVTVAGNDFGRNLDVTPFYPGSYAVDNVIVVAATDDRDRLAAFSNRGAVSVDLAAPGVAILSTVPGGYELSSGTSMAAPHVSGALALLFGRTPGIDGRRAKEQLLAAVDSIPALTALVRRAGRLNVLAAIGDPDTLAPGAIADLAVTGTPVNAVRLAWTATGDDGDVGRASRHDLRSSTAPITEANFALATAHPAPDPPPAGALVEVDVQGLAFGALHYFAVRARDEIGNLGPVSNVVSYTTPGPPRLDLEPAAIEHTLRSGESVSRRITLRNHGESALDFSIPAPLGRLEAQAAQPYTELPQGAPDPRVGPPVVDARGGPDAGGYRWVDSNDAEGPEFAWIDLAGIGAPVNLIGDEDVAAQIPIGFPFTFYGTTFNTVNVAANGWLSFTSTVSPTFTPQPLPNPGGRTPENLIAPYWTDLHFRGAPRAFYHTDGRRFVVSYLNAQHFALPAFFTFQVILEANGTIRFQYLEVLGPREFASIGIQNATKDVGLQVAFNTRYIRPGLAVSVIPPPGWLGVSPRAGRVASGGSLDLDLDLSAAGLFGGRYGSDLQLVNNDPARPQVSIPISLDVIGVPEIEVSASSFDYGTLFVGASNAETLIVTNQGTDTLQISGLATDVPAFVVPPGPIAIPPFRSHPVVVTFAPAEIGDFEGALRLISDDPDEAVVTVALRGRAIPPPRLAVAVTPFEETLAVGGKMVRTLRVENTGTSVLTGRVSVESAPPPSAPPLPARAASRDAKPSDPTTLAGTYAGDYLSFGVSDLGEIVPFQHPAGNEHVNIGSTLSGYTVGYRVQDNLDVYYAARDQVFGILPVSYREITSDADRVVAEVVTSTRDGRVRIVRTIEFPRRDRFVRVSTRIENVGTAPLEGLVFKEFADWDVDSDIGDDDWRYERPLHAVIASDVHFVALASDRRPEQMDLFGVTDIVRYATTAEPMSPVLDVDGLALLHHELGDVAPGANRGLSTAYAAHADLEGLRQTIARAVPYVGWLTAEPGSFEIASGAAADLAITLDASSLLGADYRAVLRLDTNDPDRSVVRIPASLHVVGAANLIVMPAAVEFDSTFVVRVAAETLVVRNDGTDSLRVSAVTADRPEFQAAPSAFVLGPDRERRVALAFAPDRAGASAAVLRFDSNDPDAARVLLPLRGVGLDPPVAVVAQTALAARVIAGRSVVRTLSIENRGGSRLEATLLARPPGAGPVARVAVGDAASDGETAIIDAAVPRAPRSGRDVEDGHDTPVAEWATWVNRALRSGDIGFLPRVSTGDLPVVLEDAIGDGGRLDLARVRAAVRGGALHMSLEMSGVYDRFDFGGVVSLDLDRNRATGYPPTFGRPGHDIGADAEIGLFVVEFGLVELYLRGVYAGAFPADVDHDRLGFVIPLAALDDDGLMDVTGVVGTGSGPTDWFPESGHFTLNPADWVTVEPARVAVLPGARVDLRVRMNAAGLDPGEHHARLLISTNDPAAGGASEVAVTMTVVEAPLVPPDLSVSRAPLRGLLAPELGAVATAQTRTLVVRNRGAGTLHLEAEADAGANWLVANWTPAPIPPGDSAAIAVRFDARGLAAGDYAASVSLISDDPDSPEVVIPCVLHVGALLAEFEIEPGTLNPRSNGRWAQAKLTLPSSWDPRHVDLSSVRVANVVPVAGDGPVSYAGPQVQFKLDRAALIAALAGGEESASLVAVIPDRTWVGAAVDVRTSRLDLAVETSGAAGVDARALPLAFGLRSAGTNPATFGATFELAAPSRAAVTLDVFDVRGARVRRVLGGEVEAGWHSVRWDGADASGKPVRSGVYFVRATFPGGGTRLRIALAR